MGLDEIAAVVGAVDGRRVGGSQTHVRVRVPDAPEHVRATVDVARASSTTHWTVPDLRNELPGAFAELKLSAVGVYVPGLTAANAAEADKATRNIDNAVTIPTRLIFIPFLLFPRSGPLSALSSLTS
jgi:hypothetical protein